MVKQPIYFFRLKRVWLCVKKIYLIYSNRKGGGLDKLWRL